jgi:murein peptide amidase A
MQRLGQNHDGYHGETIDIDALLRDVEQAARRWSWQCEALAVSAEPRLLTLQRSPASPVKRIYISTGIHGDEPAGPLAVRQLLQENPWPDTVALWLCPCLNPAGFRMNRRENEAGIDLNRDYRHLRTPAVHAHIEWLQRQPQFDLALCLHEDWESHGFYVYELNPEHRPSVAEKMIERVAAVCPIDLSPLIEGREAEGGVIRPNLDPASRPEWPEAFYLIQNKTRLSYTLEAPSDWPLATRVAALVEGTRAAVSGVSASAEGA